MKRMKCLNQVEANSITAIMNRQVFVNGGEKPGESLPQEPEKKKESMPTSPDEAAKEAREKGAKLVETGEQKAEQLSEKKANPEKALRFCDAADAYFLQSVEKKAYKNNEKAEAAMLSACDKYAWMKPAMDRYRVHADAGGQHVFDPNILATEVAEESYKQIKSHFMHPGTGGTYDRRGEDLIKYIYPKDEGNEENAAKVQEWFTQAKDVMQKGRDA